jgi:hypothetical protein
MPAGSVTQPLAGREYNLAALVDKPAPENEDPCDNDRRARPGLRRRTGYARPRLGEISRRCSTSRRRATTLDKLLLRFYDPPSGRILTGRTDLCGIDLASYHANIGMIF